MSNVALVSGAADISEIRGALNSLINAFNGRVNNDAPSISSGSGAPSSIPAKIGNIYVDTNGTKVYVSTGIVSSGDWTIMN